MNDMLWIPSEDYPPHGVEVLTYRHDRGQIRLGWWDKEINGWVVYDANGTRPDAPDWWMRLPPTPAEEAGIDKCPKVA